MTDEEWDALDEAEKKRRKELSKERWLKKNEIVGIGKNGQKYYRRIKPMAPITHKWCMGCRQMLPINCFTRDNDKSDGLSNYCKSCMYFMFQAPQKS